MKIPSLIPGGAAIALVAAFSPVSFAQEKSAAYSDTEAGKHVGEEATVTGKIASISKSGKGTAFLNFGERFPRQTFSGVMFAGDAEKIGDISKFDGKTVALAGRIELSPDGKPQIIIKSPDQLKIADGSPPSSAPTPTTPATPMPPPTVATAPAPSAIPAPQPTPPPKGTVTRRIALAANWATAPQAGDMTRKDLAALFGGQIASGESAEQTAGIVIYPEVPYLTPLASARKNLKLENTTPARLKITTPGLPVGSLTANAFAGIFPGGFTTMTLVTDSADQMVSVHLTDENPRQRTEAMTDTSGYHTYNFIAQRTKSAGQLVIKHEVLREGAPAGVVVVDSLLIDPLAADPAAPPRTTSRTTTRTTPTRPRTGKVLERSRWYVPKPLVSIILRASGNR